MRYGCYKGCAPGRRSPAAACRRLCYKWMKARGLESVRPRRVIYLRRPWQCVKATSFPAYTSLPCRSVRTISIRNVEGPSSSRQLVLEGRTTATSRPPAGVDTSRACMELDQRSVTARGLGALGRCPQSPFGRAFQGECECSEPRAPRTHPPRRLGGRPSRQAWHRIITLIYESAKSAFENHFSSRQKSQKPLP